MFQPRDDVLKPTALIDDTLTSALSLADVSSVDPDTCSISDLETLSSGDEQAFYHPSAPIDADPRESHLFPTLIFHLTEDTLRIEKQEAQKLERLFETNLAFSEARSHIHLGGFLDAFTLSLNDDYGFSLELDKDNPYFNVQVFSTVAVVLRQSLSLKGQLHLQAPSIVNEAPLTARRLEVRTEHFNNQHTIHTEEGYLASRDYTLVPKGIWYSKGDLQIDQADHLMTQDFSVHFKSLETLGLSLNNGCTLEKPLTFPGSLRLAVLAPD